MAPSVDLRTGSAEIYFAKKLANNEKKVRDKALKKLKLWLRTRSNSETEFDELELLKLWKGLFYCMWFSDKPLVQEELADSLAQLVHIFPADSENGILFSNVFFTTIGREWLGIDRLRLDKFYMLVKNFITELLIYIRNSKWSDTLVSTASVFFSEQLLDEKYPAGLKMYYAEQIIPELTKVCSDSKEYTEFDSGTFLKLMEPYCSSLALSPSNAVIRTIRDEIFESLLNAKFTYNVGDKKKLLFKVPFCQIADRLCELGAQKNVQTKNRKILFLYVDKYRKHAEQLEVTKNKRQRKRKKKVASVDVNDNEEIDNKKKKKKKKRIVNGENNTKENSASGNEQDSQVTESTKKTDMKINSADNVDFEVLPKANEKVESSVSVKKRKKKQNKSVGPLLPDAIEEDNKTEDVISTELSTPGNEDIVKLKLNFTSQSDDSCQDIGDKPLIVDCNEANDGDVPENNKPVDTPLSKKKKKSIRDKPLVVACNEANDADIPENNKPVETPLSKKKKKSIHDKPLIVACNEANDGDVPENNKPVDTPLSKKKKKSKKHLSSNDDPQPISFVKTPLPHAFCRKTLMKSEPARKKKSILNKDNKPVLSTPMSESSKKKFRIDVSKNISVAHKDLKIHPSSPFSPTRKPKKSIVKTPLSARGKASDFF